MSINQKLRNLYGIAHDLPTLAAAFRLESDAVTAARLLGATDALLDDIEAALEAMERKNYEKVEGALIAEMGEEAFASARHEGRSITWEQVVEMA
jgi:hypothetical protein